jgi:AhpD family alkylhydroperoxidase
MRLRILDRGHDLPTRLTFAVVRRMAHAEVPEVIKVAAYRHRYFGTPFHVLVQDLMRGPSSWTVGERELFAAFTSSRNQCQFCTTAHQAFAASCAGDDVVAVQAAGVDDLALEEAVRISALFHVINRIMDAAGAGPLQGPSLDLARRIVMGGGYKLPPTIRWLSRGH